MAQQVVVEMVDDIDGGIAAQTVPFSLDGVSYEIDLSDDNAAALRDELARYVAVARRTGGRRIRLAVGQSTTDTTSTARTDRERSQRIRAWATDHGYAVSDRGRISADVIAAFDEAERATANAEQPAKASRKRTTKKKIAAAKR